MSITAPENARGPVLDLALPASEPPVKWTLRNITTGKSLSINLPEFWGGLDLSLDFRRRTIQDSEGADRSALLDTTDNTLWTPDPLIAGVNDVQVEADGAKLVAKDDFNQAAGAVTAKALEEGGKWEADGSANDFSVVAGAEHLLRRTAKSDASASQGRRIWASAPSVAAARSQVDISMTGLTAGDVFLPGAFCRRTGGLRLEAFLQRTTTELIAFLALKETTATKQILAELHLSATLKTAFDAGSSFTIVTECVGGLAKGWFGLKGALPDANSPQITGTHEYLEGKGAVNMSTGAVGINDSYPSANSLVRNYDRFRAFDLAAAMPYPAQATLRWQKGYA